jgi:membrane associated rhomboid family serine protease
MSLDTSSSGYGSNIKSESRFIFDLIISILVWPFTLILVLLRKKPLAELIKPFSIIWNFLFGAKFTFWIIFLTIAASISAWIFLGEGMLKFAMYPQDLVSSRAYTIVTCGFLHGNLVHLLGNMLALFIFGRVVERRLGPSKTALIYFGAMIISSIAAGLIYLFAKSTLPSMGASGAVMGLIAAAILLNPFYLSFQTIIPLPIALIGALTIWADVQGVLIGVNDGIGHYAHLAGFLSVSLIMFMLSPQDRKSMLKGLLANLLLAAFMIALALGLFKIPMP